MRRDAVGVLDAGHRADGLAAQRAALGREQEVGGPVGVLEDEVVAARQAQQVEDVGTGVEDRLQARAAAVQLVELPEDVALQLLVVLGQRLDRRDLGVDVGRGADEEGGADVDGRDSDQVPAVAALDDAHPDRGIARLPAAEAARQRFAEPAMVVGKNGGGDPADEQLGDGQARCRVERLVRPVRRGATGVDDPRRARHQRDSRTDGGNIGVRIGGGEQDALSPFLGSFAWPAPRLTPPFRSEIKAASRHKVARGCGHLLWRPTSCDGRCRMTKRADGGRGKSQPSLRDSVSKHCRPPWSRGPGRPPMPTTRHRIRLSQRVGPPAVPPPGHPCWSRPCAARAALLRAARGRLPSRRGR